MTTSARTLRTISLLPVSSIEPELWAHPMLALYRPDEVSVFERKPLLYAVPTRFNEEYDPDFSPQPTSASELPDIAQWALKFGTSVLEIWAGKRQPAQLARWCHRGIYPDLVKAVGSESHVGKIRKLHQTQPLDGICETMITVRFEDRIRALVIRFEGVDHRWLCTCLTLL